MIQRLNVKLTWVERGPDCINGRTECSTETDTSRRQLLHGVLFWTPGKC